MMWNGLIPRVIAANGMKIMMNQIVPFMVVIMPIVKQTLLPMTHGKCLTLCV